MQYGAVSVCMLRYTAWFVGERERETETDRQTDREKDSERYSEREREK